jgi:hypothetical protein
VNARFSFKDFGLTFSAPRTKGEVNASRECQNFFRYSFKLRLLVILRERSGRRITKKTEIFCCAQNDNYELIQAAITFGNRS